MATFTFIMERDGDSENLPYKRVNLEFEASPDITHMELCDQFQQFLVGCGYLFNLNDKLRPVEDDVVFDIPSLGEEVLADSQWEE